MSKSRILYIDILKLFTIFLVIWGHAIMHFQPNYGNSIIFRLINSFHMPLFMMLSGYFAVSSMQLDVKLFIVKKFRQLLLPCLSWGGVCWLVITSGLIYGEFNLQIKKLFTAGWLGLIDNFWFLKSCFICYVLSWLCWRCGRYKIPAMLLIWFLCTLQGRFHLNMMFPSFLAGMYLRKNIWLEKWLSEHLYVPAIIFLTFLILKFYFIEGNPYPHKLFTGLSGAVSCFLLFKSIIGSLSPTPLLEKIAQLGSLTIGVYVLQAILLEVLLPQYADFSSLSVIWIVILMPFISILTLIVCILIVQTISRSILLACLMFGREYRKI